MARGSLAGLPFVVREAIDPGACWREVPWAHQGNRHFQTGDGLHLKLRREGMPGARLAAEEEFLPCPRRAVAVIKRIVRRLWLLVWLCFDALKIASGL